MLLPKTKPVLRGILFRPPGQSKILDKISTTISETNNFDDQEVHILCDLNINSINSQKHTPIGMKQYKEFCSLNGLKQLLTLTTRITNNSTSLLDHVLTNSADKLCFPVWSSRYGTIISPVNLLYEKNYSHKIKCTQIYIKTSSLKNYSQT